MTEEEIQSIKQSDEDPMDFVVEGTATMIEFSRNHIIGRCGKEKRNLEQNNADEGGGWKNVADLIQWEELEGGLLCIDPIIVPGHMKDESVSTFIEQMECALTSVIRGRQEVENDIRSVENGFEP